ncbi:hypothetical protein EVA_11533 [gut metagenome]|uniref:Uncharacterized protein n=1 Tax=gut metagenome TaxID=749906 RepID=J9FZF3_9ZZZZ
MGHRLRSPELRPRQKGSSLRPVLQRSGRALFLYGPSR